MQIAHRITIQATPAAIFRIYADVAHWHTWDPDTRSASLDGPFQVGSTGKLTPTKGNTVPMRVTQLVEAQQFTVEAKIPLFCMVFEHLLQPQGNGTEVTHRVTFSGPLTFLLGRLLCRQLNRGLPVTLRRLKQLAEQGHVD